MCVSLDSRRPADHFIERRKVSKNASPQLLYLRVNRYICIQRRWLFNMHRYCIYYTSPRLFSEIQTSAGQKTTTLIVIIIINTTHSSSGEYHAIYTPIFNIHNIQTWVDVNNSCLLIACV